MFKHLKSFISASSLTLLDKTSVLMNLHLYIVGQAEGFNGCHYDIGIVVQKVRNSNSAEEQIIIQKVDQLKYYYKIV
jgi:hypothetical protein